METIGSKQSYTLTRCMKNNDDGDDENEWWLGGVVASALHS